MNIQTDAQALMQPKNAAENLAKLAADLLFHKEDIDKALAYTEGTHLFDDVVNMIMTGQLIFWAFADSFVMMEVIKYPQCSHLNIFLAGGRLTDFATIEEDAKRVARANGCSAMTMGGRAGWRELLVKGHGWKDAARNCIYQLGEDNGV